MPPETTGTVPSEQRDSDIVFPFGGIRGRWLAAPEDPETTESAPPG